MKTTIEIPDGLFRRAKSAAAADGISLKDLVADALRLRLGARAPAGSPPWQGIAGELRDLRGESRRIERAIEREFEQLDEEDR